MQLQESGQMYLETIWILSQRQPYVRAIDVGEYMNYSKPSVSRALGLLKQGGYLTVEESGHLALTEAGREAARKTYERHTILTDFFCRLGVDPAVAAEDACKIEHHMSDETFAAIKRCAEQRGASDE